MELTNLYESLDFPADAVSEDRTGSTVEAAPAPAAPPKPATPAPTPTPQPSGGMLGMLAARPVPAAPNAPAAPGPAAPAVGSPAPPETGPAQGPSKPAPTAAELQATAANYAKTFAATLVMINNGVCSAIGGGNRDSYAPTQKEVDEYVAVCTPYFAEQGEVLSPKMLFIMATASFVGVGLIKAMNDRKETTQRSTARQRVAVAKQRHMNAVKTSPEAAQETAEELSHATAAAAEAGATRKRFEIDKDGFYSYDESGNYIKGPKTQKPPAWIAEICALRKYWKSKGLPKKPTWGNINKRIRSVLDDPGKLQQYAGGNSET